MPRRNSSGVVTGPAAPTTAVVLGYTSIDGGSADARTMLDVMHLGRRYAQAGQARDISAVEQNEAQMQAYIRRSR